MNFPKIKPNVLLKRLEPPKKKVRIVLDTDTYNEVDDQFALAYALKSHEHIDVEAVYAAPFHNNRSNGPKDGMEKSYQEIIKMLNLLGISHKGFVFQGSTAFLKDWNHPQNNDAVKNLIDRAMSSNADLLYVVAIGAITNIASAILIEPRIIEKIVVVWLGGNAFHWPNNYEFNLKQDPYASKLIFDCGVPLINIPCWGITSHLTTTIPELDYYLKGKSKIADYLLKIVKDFTLDPFAWSKVLWDVATIAWFINPDWVPSNIIHSPIVTSDINWSFENSRHFIRSAYYANRDLIFKDLFLKLSDRYQEEIL